MNSKTVKIRPDGEILSGASYCYRKRQAALEASNEATVCPGSRVMWFRGHEYYLGRGEVSASTRETTWYGRGGAIVRVVEVAS